MMDAALRKSSKIISAKREGNALFLSSERGILRFLPQNESIVRITYTEEAKIPDYIGAGIIHSDSFGEWSFDESDENIILSLPCLTVKVNRETSSVSYYDENENLLLSERKTESRIFESYSPPKTGSRKNVKLKKINTPDGVKTVLASSGSSSNKKLCRARLYLEFAENEKLFGLGQSDNGVFNLRGTVQYLHQANMKIAVPLLLSTNGYGLLLSAGGASLFSDTANGSYIRSEADKALDFYFIRGELFDDIIKGYRFLTGKAAMLPKWAFGFLQSQERYESQEEILKVSEEFKKHRIGVDCLILDWMSWKGDLWGQKTFDKKRFPSPREMTDKLHENNIRFMISIWPNMSKKCSNFKEFKRRRLLLPKCDIYNAFDPKGASLYWKQLKKGLYKHGIDGWWCDSSEPFTPEWSCAVKPEPFEMYKMFIDNAARHIPPELINTYGAFHAKTIYDGQRNENDGKRVINLTRSTYTGGQKYGVIPWSGDISASWDTLKNQIASGLNFCASGFPYWTFDIGAFFVKKGIQWFWNGDYNGGTDDLGYRELFTRWFQLGAFLPIFRSHGTDVRREIWNFGKEGEMFYDALVNANRLRYSLIPYIYSLAGKAYFDDSTIMRMLAFDFKNDEKACEINNQFMFGDYIMVCPVTEPMYYSASSKKLSDTNKTRKVYLPEGTDWYDFYTDKKYSGGQEIKAEADIPKIPLFARAGSIIPMTKPLLNTAEENEAEIIFNVYPGKDGRFKLYEDGGDGYGYEKGEYSFTEIIWNDSERILTVPEKFNRPYRTIIHG